MADLTPGQTRALQYWGVIESATLAGANTQDLWQRINDQAESLGYPSAGVSARDVATLRSRAVAIRNSRDTLHSLGDEDLIDASAIGRPPWERSLSSQNLVPMYQVRFEHAVTRDGVQTTEWRTSVFTSTFPRTKLEMEEALNEDATGLADSYGVQNGGIGDYFILQV